MSKPFMFKPLFSVRINSNDPEIVHKITSLWIRALGMPEGVGLSKNFYGVYHNHESGDKGDCDLSISIKAPKSDPSTNLIALGKKYRKFEVGEILPENIYRVWNEIWELEKKGVLNRQYDTDYEEYRLDDGTATIFISIK